MSVVVSCTTAFRPGKNKVYLNKFYELWSVFMLVNAASSGAGKQLIVAIMLPRLAVRKPAKSQPIELSRAAEFTFWWTNAVRPCLSSSPARTNTINGPFRNSYWVLLLIGLLLPSTCVLIKAMILMTFIEWCLKQAISLITSTVAGGANQNYVPFLVRSSTQPGVGSSNARSIG